jgi:hypothetical protein
MTRRREKGFTLVEFVIAIVFIAVVLGPFLLFVARIHDLNNAMGQQGRREAWRSFNDQAVAAGIDPSLAPALASPANAAVPAVPATPVKQVDVAPVAGLPRIVPIQVAFAAGVAESRMTGAGLQIGAGAAVAARTVPAAPLQPIVMPMPLVTPTDGSIINPATLASGSVGAPYTLPVQAASSAGTKVFLTLNQPFATVQGSGFAQQIVSAVDLLNRVSGAAWSEYSGSAIAGDRSVTLGDGRTRWFVTRDDGRLQIFEPSATATFAYQIDLGTPVVTDGTVESANGAVLPFDYAAFLAVQNGSRPLRIDFPTTVRAAFGNAWASQAIGFQFTFGTSAGPFSGDLQTFFSDASLPLWTDATAVAATPVVPAGGLASGATWTFTRLKTQLGVPVLSSSADSAGFFAPGQLDFSVPTGPGGTTVGRLSFENGTTVSTGTTLSISVTP